MKVGNIHNWQVVRMEEQCRNNEKARGVQEACNKAMPVIGLGFSVGKAVRSLDPFYCLV